MRAFIAQRTEYLSSEQVMGVRFLLKALAKQARSEPVMGVRFLLGALEFGSVAQLVEQCPLKALVRGSSPRGLTL